MDLKTIQGELRKLSALVEGWEASGRMPALERDLALEKLRTLYDAMRFGAAESPAESLPEEEAEAVPVTIDLGEVLSLDPLSAVEPGPEPAPEIPEPAAGPVSESESASGSVSEESASEPESAEAFTEPEPTAIPDFVSEPAMPEAEPASAEPEPVSEPVSEEPKPAGPEIPAAETVPEPAAGAHPVSETPAAAEKPRYVAPTLFGLEEDETVRHRHKQRVIMSLYDTPGPSERHGRPETPAPEPLRPETSAAEPLHPEPAAVQPAAAPAETPVPEEAAAPKPQPAEPFAEPETAAPASGMSEPATPALEISESSAPAPEMSEPQSGEESAVAEPETPAEIPQSSAPDGEEPEAELPAGTVLGDVINHDVQTLADTIAPPLDRASELRRSEPVTDLRKAIGINDKFLLIRDLFGGDGDAYETAIGTLNDCADFDDCMIYIAENYAWNPNSDGVKLLMELLERKFA